MSLDGLTEKLKAVFSALSGSKKALAIVSAAFLVLVFLVSFLQNLPEKKAVKKIEIGPPPVVPLFEEPLLPEKPELAENYGLFRQPGQEWTDEEIKRWFALPDGAVFEELRRANSALANDILGGVP